jgi:hypothetical protein
MSFLDKFEQAVKIGPWLQFVGYQLIVGGMLFAALELAHASLAVKLAFGLAYIGLGVSQAGYLYDKIYP